MKIKPALNPTHPVLQPLQRRTLIKGIAQSLVLTSSLSTLGWPMLSSAASGSMTTRKLTDRLTLISGAGGNVVLFRGDQSATLIDSGNQDNAANLVALTKELSESLPVTTLFNTHWHEDHTGGNEAFQAQGTQIISHVNTGLWLGADFDVEWRGVSHMPRPAAALPSETFYLSGEKDLGGETVQYHHYEQAHTDGDVALYFPDSNVLIAGGLMSDGTYPTTDIATGGWIGGLIKANAAMLELINDDTIVIPDQGPARSKADLEAQHTMLSSLYEVMKDHARLGYSGQDMLDAGLSADYDDQWGDPEEFILETYRGMWAHTSEMGGFI